MAVPPVLRGDDYARGDDGLHKYCRTVMCNNIQYGITWGVFATWASEFFRLKRLHLVEMNANPDKAGRHYFAHFQFATKQHAMDARLLLHTRFRDLSPPGSDGLHCYPCHQAKARGYDGWWE